MSADPPSSSGSPGRPRPQLSDLSRETTEDDLWNLDEDPAPARPAQPRQPAAPRAVPVAPEIAPSPRGIASPVKAPAARSEPLDESEIAAAVPVAPEPAAAPSPPLAAERPEPAAAPPAVAPKSRWSRREVVGLASFGVIVMVAALWVLARFFSQLTFAADALEMPDFPVKGEIARLSAADTHWREPIRDGDQRDVARREVILIPVLDVTLDAGDSGSGALRVIFRNDEGKPVGDPITRAFSGGSFAATGSGTASFPATDGFLEQGEFQAYRTGIRARWTADLLEGPSADSPAQSFRKLSTIPISTLRR